MEVLLIIAVAILILIWRVTPPMEKLWKPTVKEDSVSCNELKKLYDSDGNLIYSRTTFSGFLTGLMIIAFIVGAVVFFGIMVFGL